MSLSGPNVVGYVLAVDGTLWIDPEDACLIEAAPELLEACQEAWAYFDELANQIVCPKHNRLRTLADKLAAVIALAEGS